MTQVSVCSTQGKRYTMEDTFVVETDLMRNKTCLQVFAVFDGHRGEETAVILRDHFCRILKECICKQTENVDYELALKTAFSVCSDYLDEQHRARCLAEGYEAPDISGSTAAVALYVLDQKRLYCANVGDSEIIVSKPSGTDIRVLSELHRPSEKSERQRIEKLGGSITQGDCPRVCRDQDNKSRSHYFGLAVSRSFGNQDFIAPNSGERLISAEPFLKQYDVSEGDILVVASDGLWDVFSYREVIKEISFNTGRLVDLAINERNSQDNITLITALLSNHDVHSNVVVVRDYDSENEDDLEATQMDLD